MKITPPKGRPMLYWVGKKPIESVKSYPTQLIEVYDPFSSTKFFELPKYEDLKKDWHNLLFEGDNKEVLASLLELGFRGKIDLIYIDPPFASNKDYVRKVTLRGVKGNGIEDNEAPFLQQVMYEDIWKRDEYFQWIYERLLLLKELLNETGSIYVHLDWTVGHYVKILLDEIFGEDNFVEEIIWAYGSPSGGRAKGTKLVKNHDVIFHYAKNYKVRKENKIYLPYSEKYIEDWFKYTDENGRRYRRRMRKDENGNTLWEKQYLDESPGTPAATVWNDIQQIYADPRAYKDNVFTEASFGFKTAKPEALIERIMKHSSNENDLILDCFIGSGTTAAVAQKLGRRWIGADINKGAIQLTAKRLKMVIEDEIRDSGSLSKKDKQKYFTFAVYKVNNYELNLFQSEAKELAIKHLGIERTRTDSFFEGRLGNKIVKIIDFNHPLTLLDLEAIKEELSKRQNEVRDIVIVCYGRELNTQAWIEDWNKRSAINKIEVVDLRVDKEKGGFIIHERPHAKVEIKRIDEEKASIVIKEFISPTVIRRFNLEETLLQKTIEDYRSMIDFVLIDPNYDGKVFKSVFTDIPEKKQDLINGAYEIKIPTTKTKVAIKIADVLGDEILIVEEV